MNFFDVKVFFLNYAKLRDDHDNRTQSLSLEKKRFMLLDQMVVDDVKVFLLTFFFWE